MLAIDPARFRPAASSAQGVDALGDLLRATRPLDPARPVLVPGDPERARGRAAQPHGHPAHRAAWSRTSARVARASGVPFVLDRR